jgi:addiction module HigA family antidote
MASPHSGLHQGLLAQMRQRLQDRRVQWRQPAGVPLRVPMHPGRFLERQFLKPLSLTQGQAAQLLGVSRRRLNEIVVGRRGLSPDTALRCAMAFGLDASFWLALQSRWDSFEAWKAWRVAGSISPQGGQDSFDEPPDASADDGQDTRADGARSPALPATHVSPRRSTGSLREHANTPGHASVKAPTAAAPLGAAPLLATPVSPAPSVASC